MNLPNQLTLLRILIVPFFLVAVAYVGPEHGQSRWIALGIFILAVATDAADGLIARLKNQRTEIGSYLDPLADKLLLSTAFFALAVQDNLFIRPPVWVPIVVISRDAILIIGCAVINMLKGRIRIQPTFLGKLTTVSQMVTIFLILLQLEIAQALWVAAGALTVLSGLIYIWKGRTLLDQPANS